MATLNELRQLFTNAELKNKVESACIITAYAILSEDAATTNHAQRQKWAVQAFTNPKTIANQMLKVALAAKKASTVENILTASDSDIQTAVDNAVDIFALQL